MWVYMNLHKILVLRIRMFPAISMNMDVIVVTVESMIPALWCEFLSPKGTQEGEEYLWSTPYSEPQGSSGSEKHRRLAQDSWDMYERNDFSEPRLLHLPIYRKALNSLTCDVWFSYLTIIFWCSDYLPFVRKLLYNLASPLASSEQFSQGSWHTVSPAWSSKNSHGIKHNSQLIGCDYFSSRQGLYEDAIVCMYMNCGCMWWIYV